MQIDYDRMTVKFLLNETGEPTLLEYLNAVSEMIEKFSPSRVADKSRLSVMKENLKKAKKQARVLQERVDVLEEQNKTLKETKATEK